MFLNSLLFLFVSPFLSSLFLLLLLFIFRIIRLFKTLGHYLLRILFILLNIIVEQVGWIMLHIGIDPLLIYILVCNELFNFSARCILSWFLVIRRKSCFPIRVNNKIVDVFVKFHNLRLPLVEINRFDFSNVHLELSMHS